MHITQDLISKGGSGSGGWNKQQLDLLGVPWPPKKGWRKRVCGKHISRADAEKFLALKGATLRSQKFQAASHALQPRSHQPIPAEYQERLNDFPATPKTPGSYTAMLERQRLRTAGKLNAPVRGIRGLGRMVREMQANGFKPRQGRLALK